MNLEVAVASLKFADNGTSRLVPFNGAVAVRGTLQRPVETGRPEGSPSHPRRFVS
jgi:hypothetical protein